MSTGPKMFPVWLRAWHWLNAFLFLGLIVSGFALHYGDLGGASYFRSAVTVHNAFGVACTVAYGFYAVMALRTGHWRQYLPRKPFIGRMVRQVLYYLRDIFRGGHHPFPATMKNRFNPLQQLAYIMAVVLLFPVQIVTGFALLYPEFVANELFGVPGLLPVAVVHSVAAYVFTLFLIIHIYLALTLAEPHTGIKAMVLGHQMAPPDEDDPHGGGGGGHGGHGGHGGQSGSEPPPAAPDGEASPAP